MRVLFSNVVSIGSPDCLTNSLVVLMSIGVVSMPNKRSVRWDINWGVNLRV